MVVYSKYRSAGTRCARPDFHCGMPGDEIHVLLRRSVEEAAAVLQVPLGRPVRVGRGPSTCWRPTHPPSLGRAEDRDGRRGGRATASGPAAWLPSPVTLHLSERQGARAGLTPGERSCVWRLQTGARTTATPTPVRSTAPGQLRVRDPRPAWPELCRPLQGGASRPRLPTSPRSRVRAQTSHPRPGNLRTDWPRCLKSLQACRSGRLAKLGEPVWSSRSDPQLRPTTTSCG
ncbi:hypothetical protein QJS66_17095 [Kocuria rhizophila]|nr:hypothetical protein QJS66_17095 [Kocuria rhizophila]